MANKKDKLAEGEREIKKISKDRYEISETRTRTVNYKALGESIKNLKKLIKEKRESVGLDALEAELEKKQTLLDEITEKQD